MIKRVCFTTLVLSILVPANPCFSQNEVNNNQPVRGAMNIREARIQRKMQYDYKAGLIDSDQLAEFKRDFSGILDEEDAMKSAGMNASGKKNILKKLADFEARLNKQANLNRSKPRKAKRSK
jgi:hypothetical protein